MSEMFVLNLQLLEPADEEGFDHALLSTVSVGCPKLSTHSIACP